MAETESVEESVNSSESSSSSSLNRDLGRKTSVIWEFFSVEEDSRFAICDECEAKVPRGGTSTKSFTTSNLVNHLKNTQKYTQSI